MSDDADGSDDGRFDALRFALEPKPSRLAALARASLLLMREPRRAAAILLARLTGKRLRARQSLAALIGIDHALALPAQTRPSVEPSKALAAAGIAAFTPGSAVPEGSAAFLLSAAPGHDPIRGAGRLIAEAFAADPKRLALYGDALFEREQAGPLLPLLRPAFDRDHFLALDYVGPIIAFRRSAIDPLDAVPDNAYALLLQLADRHGAGAIGHVPRPISLWQAWRDEGPSGSQRSRLAAVERSLSANGKADARASLQPDGLIGIERRVPEPRPLVSLIVPTRDRLDLLRPCIESLMQRTDWPETEILICDNDSRERDTLAYLADLETSGRARVVPCPGPFNFAAMNNAAAREARGRVLAFVNNDVEAQRADWLSRMVAQALRPEIGAVGARLIDGEGRIQHGGIVLGTGGLVTHAYRHFPGTAPGYLGGLQAVHSVSAVTAACLVVEAGKFGSVDGFDEEMFAVDFNDVDLCLRLDEAGYRTLLVPDAVLVHREAASRRWTSAARARHEREVAALQKRWGPLLAQDPHYHPGFDPDLSTHARLRPDWAESGPARPR